jgi:hypothetical protein
MCPEGMWLVGMVALLVLVASCKSSASSETDAAADTSMDAVMETLPPATSVPDVCGPDVQACPRCPAGACCGGVCCGRQEWCDTSGTPVCRCGVGAGCPADQQCGVPGEPRPERCGFYCCGGPMVLSCPMNAVGGSPGQ